MIDNIAEYLQQRLQLPLPGPENHKKMASYARVTAQQALEQKLKVRLSAVMILLYPENDTIHTVLMQRPKSEGVHSAQMAFPGGRKEPFDVDLGATALRETEEEIGVNTEQITVLGALTQIYIPPSNYIVKPYIGYTKKKAPVPSKSKRSSRHCLYSYFTAHGPQYH